MRLALALGLVALLAIGVGLFILTRGGDAGATATATRSGAGVEPGSADPVEADAPATAPGVRTGKITTPVIAQPVPDRAAGGTSGPSLGSSEAAPVDASTEVPYSPAVRAVKNSLRKQVDAIDSYVADCVGKTPTKANGTAHLTVEFARAPNGKVTVTTTGVDTEVPAQYDNATLLTCLHETGRRMLPDIPEDFVKVTAKHQVDLENGGLVGHKLSAFEVYAPNATEPLPKP